MVRQEVIAYVNQSITEENGLPLRIEGSLLMEAGLDSFGLTVLFLDLEVEFSYLSLAGGVNSLHIGSITLRSIVDTIMKKR